MTKQTRRKLLRPVHHTLTALAFLARWFAGVFDRAAQLLGHASDLCDPARGVADMVELRDALTGEPLGLTKAQYRRFKVALGSEDPRLIAKAVSELRERRRSVLAALATAACLLLTQGCTKANNARQCVKGEQQECACPGGLLGAQVCLEDGSGFDTCMGCRNAITDEDLAGADLAGVDFAGVDLPPTPADLAFAGITCGPSVCGPIGDPNGGGASCCVNTATSATSCKTNADSCHPPGVDGYVQIWCDGTEDCPGGRCWGALDVIAESGAMRQASASCDTGTAKGAITQTTGTIPILRLLSMVCHTNADCVGMQGTSPGAGTVAFDHCCTTTGNLAPFCAPGSFANSTPGASCL